MCGDAHLDGKYTSDMNTTWWTNTHRSGKVAGKDQAVERLHMLSHACMRYASHTSHDHTVSEWESLCAASIYEWKSVYVSERVLVCECECVCVCVSWNATRRRRLQHVRLLMPYDF